MVSLVYETYSFLLVIGDPGSGKTTLLKHYALACLENEHYTTLGFKEPVLVFYFPLRALVKKGTDYNRHCGNNCVCSVRIASPHAS